MVSRDGRMFACAASPNQHDHFTADYDIFVARMDPKTLEVLGEPVRYSFHPGCDRFPDVFLAELDAGSKHGPAPNAPRGLGRRAGDVAEQSRGPGLPVRDGRQAEPGPCRRWPARTRLRDPAARPGPARPRLRDGAHRRLVPRQRGRQRPSRRVSQEQPTDRRGVDPPGPPRPVGARPDRHLLQQRATAATSRSGRSETSSSSDSARRRPATTAYNPETTVMPHPGRGAVACGRHVPAGATGGLRRRQRGLSRGKRPGGFLQLGAPSPALRRRIRRQPRTGRGRSKASPSTAAPLSRVRSSAMRPSTTSCCGRASRSRKSKWRRSWSRSPRSRRSRRSSRTGRP